MLSSTILRLTFLWDSNGGDVYVSQGEKSFSKLLLVSLTSFCFLFKVSKLGAYHILLFINFGAPWSRCFLQEDKDTGACIWSVLIVGWMKA